MEPETPLRGRGPPFRRTLTTPASSSSALQTPASQRKSAQSNEEKLINVLNAITDANWTVPRFLAELFKDTSLRKDSLARQRRTVTSMLNGTSKPYLGEILDLVYARSVDVNFKASDNTIKSSTEMFNPDVKVSDIQHARPAMTTWAVRRAAKEIRDEADNITEEKAGLHLRARTKQGSRHEASRISWEAVQHFSFRSLQEIAQEYSPAMRFLLNAYTNKEFLDKEEQGLVVPSRQRRPQDLVAVSAHMSLVFACSNRANLYPMCRGIWMFAAKAANTSFRVDSRLGLCVAHSTVYEALKEMGRQKQVELRQAVETGKHFIVVFDNIQAHIKQRDRRIGRENRMITGLAATAVEMEDYTPDAFDLKELLS